MLIKCSFNLFRQKTNRKKDREEAHGGGGGGGGGLKNTNGQWNGNR